MFNAARLYFLIFPIIFVVAILFKMGYDDLNNLSDPSDTIQTVLNFAIFSASMTLVLVLVCVFDSVCRRGETENNVQETGMRTASEVDEENISKIIV